MIQVVVPSYRCGKWIGRCLDSLVNQENVDFIVSVIDDASPDVADQNILELTASSYGFEHWSNPINMGAGYNISNAIHRYDAPDDIIVLVDGDDFLAHNRVLERVAEVYEEPDVWMMWSQYEPFPYYTSLTADGQPYEVDPRTTNRTQKLSTAYTHEQATEPGFFRREHLLCNHLITFRRFLFQESVTPDDLKLWDGSWAKAGYDRMIFTPMLERAGYGHIEFIDEVLYCYNSINPQSDVSVRRVECDEARARVLSLPMKPLLSEERVEQIRGAL